MARDQQNRTILDDDGAPHAYVLTPHKPSDGLKIGPRLVALAGPALASLIGGFGSGPANLTKLLEQDLDLGAMAKELSLAILREDVSDLAKKMLAGSLRDGMPLDNSAAFEVAYQANYGELAEALAAVVEVNRFVLFFSRIVGRFKAPPTAS
jgi:hypothetical protein